MPHQPSKPKNLLHLLLVAGLLAGLLSSLAPARPAHAATFTVDTTTDSNAVAYQACTGAANDCSLRGAITKANALAGADTIILPAGTYTLTLAGASEDLNATGDLDLTSDITLNGAGAGSTIIDANQLDRVLSVFSARTVTLNGVTLRNGSSPNNPSLHLYGGGVYNRGTLTITDSAVSDNATDRNASYEGGYGGGVYTEGGTLKIINSTVSGNRTGDGGSSGAYGGRGGGVYIASGTTTIQDSTISGNVTGKGSGTWSGGDGGGVYNHGGTLEIINSVISGNTTGVGMYGGSGGGVENNNGALTIRGSVIRDNVASDGSDYGGSGGGVDTVNKSSGSMTIQDSTISGNRSGAGGSGDSAGGGLNASSGVHTLTNVTISGNVAKGDGGGIFHSGSGSTLTLVHCTITANTADSNGNGDGLGGGIIHLSGTLAFTNTIVAGNHDQTDTGSADCEGTLISGGYNLVGYSCPSGGAGDKTTSNARLGPLQDNGGPTPTHALLFGSPALEVIPSGTNGCGTDTTTDQRGATRPGGGACDVGAFEAPNSFWDGGGADNNTSTAANWSGDALPDATDIATFWSGSSKNATVDTGMHVGGWRVDSGYGGTIAQGSSALTVGGDWTQSGGTFTGGSGVLDIAGGFNQSGGTFTAPFGLMTIAGIFHHTGGTFDPNGGRVVLASTTNQTLASTFHDLAINDGLLGYWKLDEGGGTTAYDASGYGYDGVLNNSPVWYTNVPATMGFYDPYSLGFDRTSSPGYVAMSDTLKINAAQKLTLSTWVRLNATPTGAGYTYMRFITLGGEKAVLRYYDYNGASKLQFYMKIGGSFRSILVTQTWATNTWYHVAGTYDGSVMRLYLDGVEKGTYAFAGTVNAGNGVHLSHDSSAEALDGRLDDVRIYDRALSAAEIGDLAAGKHPQTSVATTTLGAALDVNGDLTLNSGTLDVSASNYAINVAGDFIRNGGVFTGRSGAVTFDGTVTQTLATDAIAFYNLAVSSGSTLIDRASFTVDGTLTSNGTLQQRQFVQDGGTTRFLRIKNAAGDATQYYGLDITIPMVYSDGGMEWTTVTIKDNQDCTTTSGETVQRCFEIAPTRARPADLLFYFADSQLSGNACDSLNAYHWTGSAWGQLTLDTAWGDDGRVCEAEPYSVKAKNVSSFSPFVLKVSGPTAVTLRALSARSGAETRFLEETGFLGLSGITALSARLGVVLVALVAVGGLFWIARRKRSAQRGASSR